MPRLPPSATPPREYSAIAKAPPPAAPAKPRARPRKPATPRALPATPGTPRKKATAAGPAANRRGPATADAAARLDQLQALIIASLEDDKAEAVMALDLAGRASFADRMVIATGIADRQITAMATHLEEKLREAGVRRVQIEGANGADWVLIDAGDIIVHLFKPEARQLYALERMWGAELDEAGSETA